ncbi:MAG: hypothetical protein VYB25_08345, partial [Pseudomonadota bacterium]|nr:hypothetical protein [Pseudomonadota bacterium]
LPMLAAQVLDQGGTMMADWDHNLERDSAAAALWNVWYHRHLEPALMTMLDEEANSSNSPNLDTLTALKLL